MTPAYAVGVRSWHDLGGTPRMVSTLACGECAGDHDANGLTTVPDIFAYIADFMGNDARADVDGVAGVAVPDIFAFLSSWFGGCS